MMPREESPSSPATSAPSQESQWGRDWLGPLGLMVLLTGLVFVAQYLFRGSFPGLAWLKLLFIYGVSAGVFWLGRQLEVRGELRYGRILIGGAAVGIFYATFAAH